mgnify:FL=1
MNTDTQSPHPVGSSAWLCRIVCAWLRWRYGGDVGALKPPLGYSKYFPKPWWWIACYWPRYWWWKLEKAALNRWGGEMRRRWESWRYAA